MKVAGRLDMNVVTKYIEEVRATSDYNRISVMSLYGKTANEQTGYIDSMYYLTSKNKVGVVNNFMGALKDVYLVPLHENRKVPDFMEPINGCGLTDEHPAIILALLVRKSEKKKTKHKSEKHKKEEEKKEKRIDDDVAYSPSVTPPPVAPPMPMDPGGPESGNNVPISNDLFNSIKETLNNPQLKPLVPPVRTLPQQSIGVDKGWNDTSPYSQPSQ